MDIFSTTGNKHHPELHGKSITSGRELSGRHPDTSMAQGSVCGPSFQTDEVDSRPSGQVAATEGLILAPTWRNNAWYHHLAKSAQTMITIETTRGGKEKPTVDSHTLQNLMDTEKYRDIIRLSPYSSRTRDKLLADKSLGDL